MTRRADVHRRIVDDLTHHTRPEFTVAVRAIMDARPALPGATAYDGTRRSESSSSVETLALTPDRTAAEIAQLDRVLRRLEADAMWLRAFIGRHQPRHPSQRDQAQVARLNAEPDDCQHHAKLDIYEPMKGKGPTDVAGNLPHPMRLCESCYRHVYRQGVLPPADRLVREHHAGKPERTRVSTPRRR